MFPGASVASEGGTRLLYAVALPGKLDGPWPTPGRSRVDMASLLSDLTCKILSGALRGAALYDQALIQGTGRDSRRD
jgi:hypothetical protein